MCKKNFFYEISSVCVSMFDPGKMESTASLEFQNSEVTRPSKKKCSKPRHHRPYKSVSSENLASRIAEITKKVHLWEAKMESMRDKLRQHNSELALRETASSAAL
jgi:hypothetical protein